MRAKPLCHACGVPPPLIRGGFAAVKFYRNTVCYCETKPLCQGLPYQGSWRADARLRGWTKDAFSVSEDVGEVVQSSTCVIPLTLKASERF